MPHATARDGVRIHYEIRGECEPTVVLIQGLGLSSRFWFDLPDRLATGPEAWRVVTFDNRGVGRSDRSRGFYGMPAMADDVAAVLDAAGVRRACVVGISLGGMVAQHVALRHPHRVTGLVLLATTPGLPHARLPYARALATLLTLPLGGRLRPQTELAKSFARLVLSKRDAGRASELLAHWPAALRNEPTSVAVYAAQLGAALRHSTGFRLGQLACPTVVMTGDDDALMPIQNSEILARLVPGAHFEVIQGCGHVVHVSDPECVRRALHLLRDMAWRRSATAQGGAMAPPEPEPPRAGLHTEGAGP